jgi:hypothetical protein
MVARKYPPIIDATAWSDMVDTTALPLTNTGDNRVRFNETTSRWEFYIGGVLVMTIDANGRLRIKEQIVTGEAESL